MGGGGFYGEFSVVAAEFYFDLYEAFAAVDDFAFDVECAFAHGPEEGDVEVGGGEGFVFFQNGHGGEE